jgi:hypothetical protein
MSIASYFFTASREEAERNDGLEGMPPGRRAEFYRVTDISLKPLFIALSGEACPRFERVAMSEDYGQITFAFPIRFVELLAMIDESRSEEFLAKWRDSGAAPFDNDEDLRNLLANLVRLAKAGRDAGQGMFLWNCM